jgi:hypothetical protein
MLAETELGAVYFTADVVAFINVPHAAPVQLVPDNVQVTPLLLESLLTVAVKVRVWPSSMLLWVEGVTETETTGAILLELPPQAQKNNNPDRNNADALMIPPSSAQVRVRWTGNVSKWDREAI